MPARDIFHKAVKNALIKDGWQVTHDPLYVQFDTVGMYIDIGAEKILAAQKAERKIAVEVKSFLGLSTVYEFHLAVGQFINYRAVLAQESPERVLYLAVPTNIYESFFQERLAQLVIAEYQFKLIVCDDAKEVITQWIN